MTISANETPRERQVREELERRRARRQVQIDATLRAPAPIHNDERAESVKQYLASLVAPHDAVVRGALWAGVALILSQKAACDPRRGWQSQAVTLSRVAEDAGAPTDKVAAAFAVLQRAGLVKASDRTWQWTHHVDLTAYGV